MGIFNSSNKKKELSQIEIIANKAIIEAQDNNPKEELEALVLLFNKIQDSSSLLLSISSYNVVGTAYLLMGDHIFFMRDENIRRVIADNAFYCLSKAISLDKKNTMLRFKRLCVLEHFHKDFYYTIANALNISNEYNPMLLSQSMPLIVRTNAYYYSIVNYDFSFLDTTDLIEQLENLYKNGKEYGISSKNENAEVYIDQIVKYLENIYKQY